MTTRPKLPPDDPLSEEAEEARAERDLARARDKIPHPIDVAIAHVEGAKPPA